MAILYPQPIQAFRFLVRVSGSAGISAAFTRVSGIRMRVDTVQSRGGRDGRGVKEFAPALTSYGPVTLSKGVVGDSAFLDWLLAVSPDLEAGPAGGNYRRTIDVISLNERGDPAVTWTLLNAMPIGYELAPLDSSRSEVLMETVTFAVTGLRRTAAEPGL